jgi:hypothetical protein
VKEKKIVWRWALTEVNVERNVFVARNVAASGNVACIAPTFLKFNKKIQQQHKLQENIF